MTSSPVHSVDLEDDDAWIDGIAPRLKETEIGELKETVVFKTEGQL